MPVLNVINIVRYKTRVWHQVKKTSESVLNETLMKFRIGSAVTVWQLNSPALKLSLIPKLSALSELELSQ